MEFYNLTTDTAYLQTGKAEFFDHSPWEMTANPFERRMAMNLSLGSVIEAIDIATLGRVLGTATRLRRQGLTVDLDFTAAAPQKVTATIAGV